MRKLPRVIWVLALSAALLSTAKIEDWKDIQGNVFKAEPAEVIGPFALFRTSTGAGRRLPWRVLPPADCVRFHEQVGNKPAPAARWADANGDVTGRLRAHLREFVSANLLPANLNSRPEPEILIMFYVDAAQGDSWDMLAKATAPYNALMQKHPGQVEGVQFGMHQGGPSLYSGLASRANLPWMLIAYEEQPRITPLARLAPGRGDRALFALSRDGVPIFGTENPDEAAINQFFADVDALLALMRPNSPQSWPDRAHYLSALHAHRHQQDQAGPILVGDPLVPRRLKAAGIMRVEAKIEVGADGKVTGVKIKEDGSIPAQTIPHLTGPLERSAVFVPAVDRGQFVSGTYDYLLEVPQ